MMYELMAMTLWMLAGALVAVLFFATWSGRPSWRGGWRGRTDGRIPRREAG